MSGLASRRRLVAGLAAALVLAVAVVLIVRAVGGGTPAPGGDRVVTSGDDVLGRWIVVSVAGAAPPEDAVPRLTMERRDESYSALWSDGINDSTSHWRVDQDGGYVVTSSLSTTEGCSPEPCARPSGFGVMAAAQLRLTPDGDLVFVGPDGSELARYRRAPG